MKHNNLYWANLLTMIRIAFIPLVMIFMFIPVKWAAWTALILFAIAVLTDFLDGWVARVANQVSPLGRFLDPIADKLLIAAVLFCFMATDRIDYWTILPALAILLREMFVSGLREFLAEIQVKLPVTRLAKWKTTFQMIAMGFLIMGDYSPVWIPSFIIGSILLWGAAIVTLITGWDYMKHSLKHIL